MSEFAPDYRPVLARQRIITRAIEDYISGKWIDDCAKIRSRKTERKLK